MLWVIPLDKGLEAQWSLTIARFNEWRQTELFGLKWWILLTLFCLTAFLWWKMADKSRLNELVLYTSLVVASIIILDELGEELSLWCYKVDIIFLFPPITAVDITSMPLVYMLIFQYCKTWRSFTIATTVMAAVFCFIFEPIFVWSGIYIMINWQSYYGFPIYMAIALISKAAVGFALSHSFKQEQTS